jgi:signal transduction histidine kinase
MWRSMRMRLGQRCSPVTAPKGVCRIAIVDDSVGFDVDKPIASIGLIGMRERLAAVGGTIHSRSARGAATTVMFELPME